MTQLKYFGLLTKYSQLSKVLGKFKLFLYISYKITIFPNKRKYTAKFEIFFHQRKAIKYVVCCGHFQIIFRSMFFKSL